MPYNSVLTRAAPGTSPLIPEEVEHDIAKAVTVESAALQLFRHRDMGRQQVRLPVLSLLPTAYFVSGDTGLKQTTNVQWDNKTLDAEELAAVVPIPEKLLDDVDYDLWDEVKPLIAEAIAVALDAAIFFGTNKPSSWPTDIVTAAVAAGNAVTAGTSTIDIADDLNQVMVSVEADGYEVNGFWMRPQLKGTFRGLRDTQKQPIFQATLGGIEKLHAGEGPRCTLFNEKAIVSKAGLAGFAAGTGNAHAICGDWNQGIIGIRQDITMKMLDQAVLQDAAGNITFNLPQQDMVAMRVVSRYAWQVPNPVNRVQGTAASRYPFGCLRQA